MIICVYDATVEMHAYVDNIVYYDVIYAFNDDGHPHTLMMYVLTQ